jgi:hypothetical protein
MSDEAIVKDGVLEFRLEQCTYKGELWFSCKIFLGDFALLKYGRTPERALAFAMRFLAEAALQDLFKIDPWESPVKGEIMDFEGKI